MQHTLFLMFHTYRTRNIHNKVIANVREMRVERDFHMTTNTINAGISGDADATALRSEVNRLQLELMRARATPTAPSVNK